jgi:hypothetical protein
MMLDSLKLKPPRRNLASPSPLDPAMQFALLGTASTLRDRRSTVLPDRPPNHSAKLYWAIRNWAAWAD